MILAPTLAWVPMILIAIVNGAVRDLGYAKHTTELRAHQISTLSAAILFAIYVWVIARRWPLQSPAQAIMVGGVWFMLTIAFELLFGHFVARSSWAKLAADYKLHRGRLWPLLLLWLFALPYICYRLA